MDKLMQTLFYFVEDELLETYYPQTDFAAQCAARQSAEKRLRSTMTEEQDQLLEELLAACFGLETANMKAMFLASYDLSAALRRAG